MISITCRKLWSRGHPHKVLGLVVAPFASSSHYIEPTSTRYPLHLAPSRGTCPGRTSPGWTEPPSHAHIGLVGMLDLARITAGDVSPPHPNFSLADDVCAREIQPALVASPSLPLASPSYIIASNA